MITPLEYFSLAFMVMCWVISFAVNFPEAIEKLNNAKIMRPFVAIVEALFGSIERFMAWLGTKLQRLAERVLRP